VTPFGPDGGRVHPAAAVRAAEKRSSGFKLAAQTSKCPLSGRPYLEIPFQKRNSPCYSNFRIKETLINAPMQNSAVLKCRLYQGLNLYPLGL
jgi:hypothetical protein